MRRPWPTAGLSRQIKKKVRKIQRRSVVITDYMEPVNTNCDWCPQLQPDTCMSTGTGRSSRIGQIITNNLNINICLDSNTRLKAYPVQRISNCHLQPRMLFFFFLLLAQQPPVGQGLLIHEVSRSHTQWRTTVGWTALDEGSACRRDLLLATHNNPNRQTSMRRWDSNPQSQQESGRRHTP